MMCFRVGQPSHYTVRSPTNRIDVSATFVLRRDAILGVRLVFPSHSVSPHLPLNRLPSPHGEGSGVRLNLIHGSSVSSFHQIAPQTPLSNANLFARGLVRTRTCSHERGRG